MGSAPSANRDPIVLLAIGGDPALAVRFPVDLPTGSLVVAADSGLDRLLAAGIPPDHLVGDLDSAAPELVEQARRAGTAVHEHPADKDATDLELALDLIASLPMAAGSSLLVVGAGGGRLDHLLADVAALSSDRTRHLVVTAHLGAATLSIVRPGRTRVLAGQVGEQVSLLPVHGAASGVTTSGLRWALVDAHLEPGTTRAVSNELVEAAASVAVDAGVVVAIQPGTPAPIVTPRTTPYDPTPRTPGATP